MKIKNVRTTILLLGICLAPVIALAQGGGSQNGAQAVTTTHDQDEMFAAWVARVNSVDKAATPTAQDRRIIQQVMTFRKQLEDAIKAKDAAKLNDYFADDYINDLGNAFVFGKAGRLQWLLSGRAPFEVQPIGTAQFRVLDRDNVVMTANLHYTGGGNNGAPIQYGVLRTVFVFTRDRPTPTYKGWRLLVSQALRLPVVPPKDPTQRP